MSLRNQVALPDLDRPALNSPNLVAERPGVYLFPLCTSRARRFQVFSLFQAAVVLTGTSSSPDSRSANMKAILLRRLHEYHEFIGESHENEDGTLDAAQRATALESLSLLEHLHKHLQAREQEPAPGSVKGENYEAKMDPSLVGSRDLALMRTLLSIVFKWALEPLVGRVASAIPSTSALHITKGARIIDLTGLPHEYSTLSSICDRLLSVSLSNGVSSPLSQSAVAAILLNQHLSDLLLPCIVVGWLPKSLSSEDMPTGNTLRPQIMYLLTRLSAPIVISALGRTLSQTPPSLPYAQKACSFILSRQLLRPEGIRAVCESIFGEEDVGDEDAPLEKLEHVARLLGTDYCNTMVPRLLQLLVLDTRVLPPTHRRAISFSLSRILARDDAPILQTLATNIVLQFVHDPILKGTGDLSTGAALRAIEVLLTNTDPLKGYLNTWGRLVGTPEVIATLQHIIDGEGGSWRVDIADEISRADESTEPDPSLSMFTPQSLKEAEDTGQLDIDSNVLGLKPDPVRFVNFVKSIGRADVSSEMFVKLLERYSELRSQADTDPVRTLLYLQLVLQMQKQLSTDDTSSVFRKPEHILSFIKHALEKRGPSETSTNKPLRHGGLGVGDLRIVPEDTEMSDEGDSDDEDEEGASEGAVDDITSTAVKLLLAVLEANPDLSARNAPVLNDIFSLLDPLSNVPNEDLRQLAREARMVMTARLASTSSEAASTPTKPSPGSSESPQETYQKALKLLQDPLLPVRAHGLMLLRQLVSPGPGLAAPALDRALVPGILDVFLQGAQDDDSYMFLNAVQGLAAMVDGFGPDVLRALVRAHAGGLDALAASALTRQDVDVRTRVGEALGQVVRRCGDALPAYAPLLVPPLAAMVRAAHVPTVLRTSAVSLLALCVKTHALAVLPYVPDLADGMVDLLQVETVSAAVAPGGQSERAPVRRRRKPRTRPGAPTPPLASRPMSPTMTMPTRRREGPREGDRRRRRGDGDDGRPADEHGLEVPAAAARGAALPGLLVQACTARVYEEGAGAALLVPPRVMRRARTTLGYVAATDADDVVRVMARETVEGLDQLAEAVLGL
ncbi:uncharacterized protein BXZ73DRAFT_92241 [Epithele typhae]|uniref:uncharacterized protein n=1 Tax=Epithele typhae TaxID=378194 RepID=UPI0020078045|nr:uncharacterized protein BXZ73DRAFT_92241 [Epithele typhae]KAH9918173.1 hypothetical protein BXZ73DRAFT_92241 [Epithele typhae]